MSWCLRERLAPQAMWWNRSGGLLSRRCVNFTLTICILLDTLLASGYSKTEEFSKWLDGLTDIQARARVMIRIERLAMGNPGDVKAVGEGVSELRIHYGPG